MQYVFGLHSISGTELLKLVEFPKWYEVFGIYIFYIYNKSQPHLGLC